MCRLSGPHMISSIKNRAALNSNPSREHVSLPGIRSSNNGKARQAVTLPSPPARTPSSSRFSRLQFPEFREFLDSILEGYEIIPYAYRCTARSMGLRCPAHGIGLLHLNVCASILLITSCFNHAQPTLLMPAYHRSSFTDAALFSFEGTELLMKGNHKKKHNYC